MRLQVNEWLERGLESYYPVLFVDCVHIKIHRKRSVSSEAFYVALAATGEDRGLERVGLVVVDGIKGLDTVLGEKFLGTPLQRCLTHLKCNMFAKVSHGDKGALVADLRDIFCTGQRDYTFEMSWQKW